MFISNTQWRELIDCGFAHQVVEPHMNPPAPTAHPITTVIAVLLLWALPAAACSGRAKRLPSGRIYE